MENSAEKVIEQLRKQVQQDAQRRSEKIKDGTFVMLASKENDENQKAPQPSLNIFAKMSKPESATLFSKERKSVNLFQIKPRNQCGLDQNGAQQEGKNIFLATQKPAVENDDSNSQKEASQEDDVLDKSQSQNIFKSDPDVKQMKYEYKNELTKKLQIPLKKFKNGTSPARQQLYLTLQSSPAQPSTLHLIVRTNTTKVLIYQCAMIKNISIPQHFLDKKDNLKFDVIKTRVPELTQEGNQRKYQYQREVVKLQFLKVEDCEEFMRVVGDYFGAQK